VFMNRRLPVLMFHHLEDASGPICFPPSLFRDFMSFLNDEGYKSITLGEAADCIGSGCGFPEKSFVLTFDDGFRSIFDIAFPVIAENRIKATIFLTSGRREMVSRNSRLPSVEGREMLSWKEIEELASFGFEPAAHTMTHPDLTCLKERQVFEEAYISKEIIEQRTGKEVKYFAYPFGSFNSRVQEVVSGIFQGSCSVRLGMAGMESNPYAIERVDAFYLKRESLFRMMPSRIFPLYLGGLRVPRIIRRCLQSGRCPSVIY